MQGCVQHLASCRKVKDGYKQEILELENELAETSLGQRLVRARELLGVARADVTDAVDEVQARALGAYEATGNKVPHPAVKVALFTVLDYAPGDALEYARLHLPKALKLDKRTFEKMAKVIEPDFVTISQEPRVRIARDLSAYLEEETE